MNGLANGEEGIIITVAFAHSVEGTDKAHRLLIKGRWVWLPKCITKVDFEEKIVSLPGWLAKQKELI